MCVCICGWGGGGVIATLKRNGCLDSGDFLCLCYSTSRCASTRERLRIGRLCAGYTRQEAARRSCPGGI